MNLPEARGKISENLHLVVGEIEQKVTIIYHIHLIENKGFLEDLIWKTKAPGIWKNPIDVHSIR